MAKDERLLPLPTRSDIQLPHSNEPTAYAPMTADDDAFAQKRSFRDYVSIILKRRWLILSIVTIVTALALFYMMRQPSIYQSQTQLLIEPPKPKSNSDKVNINFGGDARYWDTQVRLIQNASLMRDVALKLNIHRNPQVLQVRQGSNFFQSLFGGAAKTEEATTPIVVTTNEGLQSNGATPADATQAEAKIQLTPEEEKKLDGYALMLLGGVKVEPIDRTNLVTIFYQHTNPELAVAVPNAIAETFIENDIKRATQGAIRSKDEVSKQIEELQTTLNGLEAEKAAFFRSSGLALGDETKGQELASHRLQVLSDQLLQAQGEANQASTAYQAARNNPNVGAYVNSENLRSARESARQRQNELEKRRTELERNITEIDNKITDLMSKREELRIRYTDNYSPVKQIEAQIETLRRQRAQIVNEVETKIKADQVRIERDTNITEQSTRNEVLGSLQSNYQAAAQRVAKLQADYAKELRDANLQGQAATRMTNLDQEISQKRKQLDSLYTQQTAQQIDENASRPDNIKITTAAQKPANLVGPNRVRNVGFAFLLSLLGSIALAFLLDYLDDSVKSSDDIGRQLGLPTLALIPHQSLIGKRAGRGALPTGKDAMPASSTALISLEESRSALAEAYRHLRTSLLFSSAGKPPQTILITSSQPSEGKTTTAINTAITLAQAGAEVVLVDCDLRRPRLHQHFSTDNMHGLTNYLSGERNPNELLKTYDKLPNLKLITSGPIPPNPAELISSNDMRDLLTFLRANFKHVVIDSPPAISFADASILSTLVDGVVIVAMANKSSMHLIKRFKSRLQNIGARIYGVVLNGVKANSVDYGYGYGYNAYYSYSDYYADYDDDQTPRIENAERKVEHEPSDRL